MPSADRLAEALEGVDEIVVDASLCVCRFLALDHRKQEADFFLWYVVTHGIRMVAPVLFAWEVDSALLQGVCRGAITSSVASGAFKALEEMPVNLIHDGAELGAARNRARQIATDLQQSAIYDSLYFAIAEQRGVQFWTADARFANSAAHPRRQSDGSLGPSLPGVRFLSDF